MGDHYPAPGHDDNYRYSGGVSMDSQALLTIIGGLLIAAPGIYATWRQLKRDKVDNADTLSTAATKLIEPYIEEVERLRKEIDLLRCELDAERTKRRALEEAITVKNGKIAEMQVEIDTLRDEVEALQKGRRVR